MAVPVTVFQTNAPKRFFSQVGEEKNHAHTLNELNKSVEATRAHLQRELRTKEMENNRLHVQLKVCSFLSAHVVTWKI